MNGGNASAADVKMKQVSKSFRKMGLTTGALSGLTYGIYTTLVSLHHIVLYCCCTFLCYQYVLSNIFL